MLIGRVQMSNWSAKSIKRHLLNTSFLINDSNIISYNYCRKVGQKQLVPDAHLPKKLTQMNTTEETMVYGVANITTDKRAEFQVHLSDGETEPTICRIDDTDCLANQVEIEICGISSNGQMLFKMELSICLITFEAW
jgi:hypothetical protein